MAFCASPLQTIAQFSSGSVNTIESKRIITVFRINVTKLTSAPVMSKCTQTIIARTLQSIKRDSKDIVPQKSAWFSIASFTVNAQHIFTVDDASTRSRTKLTWVRLLNIFVLADS